MSFFWGEFNVQIELRNGNQSVFLILMDIVYAKLSNFCASKIVYASRICIINRMHAMIVVTIEIDFIQLLCSTETLAQIFKTAIGVKKEGKFFYPQEKMTLTHIRNPFWYATAFMSVIVLAGTIASIFLPWASSDSPYSFYVFQGFGSPFHDIVYVNGKASDLIVYTQIGIQVCIVVSAAFALFTLISSVLVITSANKRPALISVFVCALIAAVFLAGTISNMYSHLKYDNSGSYSDYINMNERGSAYYVAAVSACLGFVILIVNGFAYHRETVSSKPMSGLIWNNGQPVPAHPQQAYPQQQQHYSQYA